MMDCTKITASKRISKRSSRRARFDYFNGNKLRRIVIPVYLFHQAHFEESMAHSRKSVSEEELARYESFSTNMKSDRGFEEFSFDDKDGGDKDADKEADDVDDLYG